MLYEVITLLGNINGHKFKLYIDRIFVFEIISNGAVMFQRFRRKRLNSHLRALVRENRVTVDDFIYPLFVRGGEGIKTEVASMPGVYQMSIDVMVRECETLKALGIYSVILFVV